ncbi:uncharacterized protein LOC143573157 [Bidens hawaiensis]|uniref:uncharacterized protein LOC143573157 n=1 Tax=Bidens hawaiensis TaxID=980011 RepID=UPI004049F2F9
MWERPQWLTMLKNPKSSRVSTLRGGQQQMFFYLTTLNLAQFLEKTAPIPTAQDDAQSVSALDAWKHSEFLCRNYVHNGLADPLYNVYCGIKTAKELWESLDKKYKTEDARTKKFVVARFLDFKMVDSKTVITQVQELQVILREVHAEGMTLSETFQVAAIIEMLPPSWEDNKTAQKSARVEPMAKANMAELGQSSRGGGHKGKGKMNKGKVNLGPKKEVVKKKPQSSNFQGVCYNCNENGHRANQCKKPKRERAHMVDENGEPLVAMITELSAMIDEINLVGDKP